MSNKLIKANFNVKKNFKSIKILAALIDPERFFVSNVKSKFRKFKLKLIAFF